jgi:hypothetical protein
MAANFLLAEIFLLYINANRPALVSQCALRVVSSRPDHPALSLGNRW